MPTHQPKQDMNLPKMYLNKMNSTYALKDGRSDQLYFWISLYVGFFVQETVGLYVWFPLLTALLT